MFLFPSVFISSSSSSAFSSFYGLTSQYRALATYIFAFYFQSVINCRVILRINRYSFHNSINRTVCYYTNYRLQMVNAAIPFPSRYPNYIVRCLRNQWPPSICYTQIPSIQAEPISFQRIYPLPRSLHKFRNRTFTLSFVHG